MSSLRDSVCQPQCSAGAGPSPAFSNPLHSKNSQSPVHFLRGPTIGTAHLIDVGTSSKYSISPEGLASSSFPSLHELSDRTRDPIFKMDSSHLVKPFAVSNEGFRTEWTSSLVHACTNTGQGALLVTDSDGSTCERRVLGTLGASFGCCPRSTKSSPDVNFRSKKKDHHSIMSSASLLEMVEPISHAPILETSPASWGENTRFSCSSCDASSRCCSIFEYCVSCCMAPERWFELDSLRKRSVHSALRSTDDPFEFCKYKCRTSSGSVVHENSYRHSQVPNSTSWTARINLLIYWNYNSYRSTALDSTDHPFFLGFLPTVINPQKRFHLLLFVTSFSGNNYLLFRKLKVGRRV
jgi:hypothetical protein